jgi:hypothetical protein
MRLLLSSANRQQIHGLSQILTSAGIRSEIHIGRGAKAKDRLLINVELWLQNDNDYHTAAILCAGFTRRQRHVEQWRYN